MFPKPLETPKLLFNYLQLENEYGSYGLQTGKCDILYMNHLRDLAISLLGDQVGNKRMFINCVTQLREEGGVSLA